VEAQRTIDETKEGINLDFMVGKIEELTNSGNEESKVRTLGASGFLKNHC
jgi:hypothetical protein